MRRIRFDRPAAEKSRPWWVITLSGLLVALLAAALLAGALGGCHGRGANACPTAPDFSTAGGAHIAQAYAATSSASGLAFAACWSRTGTRD